MDFKDNSINALIELVSSAINEREPNLIKEELNWTYIYKLAKINQVESLVYYSIEKIKDETLPKEILSEFKVSQQRAQIKEATQHFEVKNIEKSFEEKGIPYMIAKGFVLKYLYPIATMRTMSDVDILVDINYINEVKNIMVNLEYSVEEFNIGNHDVYYKKPVMNIEIHRELINSNHNEFHWYYENIWEKLIRFKENSCEYKMTKEDFYIFLIVHFVKHYKNQEILIRHMTDIYIYMKAYEHILNWEYIQCELNKLGIDEFSDNIIKLSKIWFGGKESNELYDEMTEFILSTGKFKDIRKGLVNSVAKEMKDVRKVSYGKAKGILSLIFPSVNILKSRYKILNKWIILLPFVWIIRSFNIILFKRYKLNIVKNIIETKDDMIRTVYNFHSKTGLKL